MSTPRTNFPTRLLVLLAAGYPVGVLIVYVTDTWVKKRLGLNLESADVLTESLVGTAIMVTSCWLYFVGLRWVSQRYTSRSASVRPRE